MGIVRQYVDASYCPMHELPPGVPPSDTAANLGRGVHSRYKGLGGHSLQIHVIPARGRLHRGGARLREIEEGRNVKALHISRKLISIKLLGEFPVECSQNGLRAPGTRMVGVW